MRIFIYLFFMTLMGYTYPVLGQPLQKLASESRLATDLKMAGKEQPRKVGLALLASGILPGAGQGYNRQWLKMAFFGGIEAGTWAAKKTWERKGDTEYAAVQQTAHSGWSAVRYAEWLNGYSGYKGAKIIVPNEIRQLNFSNPSAWTDGQKQAVQRFFETIRAAEEQSIHVKTGAGFSHKLPFFGEQQFYELIGKYFQYAPGWTDYNGANDPEETLNGQHINASPNFLAYAEAHSQSQLWLRKASRLATVLIFNHALAAFDAGLSAKIHNNRLKSITGLGVDGEGNLYPTFGLAYRF